jgi:hypothetical protein
MSAGVTDAFCLARSATVRRRSRGDDDTAGPNRAKTSDEPNQRFLCVKRREYGPSAVMPGTLRMAKARSACIVVAGVRTA